MKRFKKITISIFIILLTLFIGVSSLVGVLFYNLALNANYSKDIIYAEYNDENLNDAQIRDLKIFGYMNMIKKKVHI